MKKFALLGILLITAGLIVNACKDDVILEPPPSIVGFYEGTYEIERGQGQNAEVKSQAITWRFTETNYFMDADTTDPAYDSDICFCKGRGTYSVSDRVRLVPLNSGSGTPDNCDSCDPSEQPEGSYTLEQPAGGLRLTWQQVINGETVTNRIVLTRISD